MQTKSRQCHIELHRIESVVAKQVAGEMEQLVSKEILTLVADSLSDILQWSYEKARTGARSVFYNVVEQMVFDMLRYERIDEFLDNRITKYFDTNDPADKVGGKLLSTNAFMAPIIKFVQRRTNEAGATEPSRRKWKSSWRGRQWTQIRNTLC